MRRSAPRPLAGALQSLAADLEPPTALGAVQRAWPAVVGAGIAAEASPTSERGGVVTVSCRAAVWAHELDLMGPELVPRLNAAVGEEVVRSLRCVATPA